MIVKVKYVKDLTDNPDGVLRKWAARWIAIKPEIAIWPPASSRRSRLPWREEP